MAGILGLGNIRVGGIMTAPKGSKMPPMWGYYTEVPNIDVAIERATKRGAKVLNGPMEVPTGARIAQLLDPQGAAFALHQQPAQ
jgi:predicted enzyme related to lactoylglutathione lyase